MSFQGNGRPSNVEVARQRRDFRALVGQGVPIDEAARRARIKPERALEELTEVVRALLAKAA